MIFLNQYPEITLVEADDTASSARLIAEGRLKNTAAIASRSAAEIYGLEIIAEGIETFKKNYTRFLVIGSHDTGNQTGNKMSVCFATDHMPGSLARVLVKLAEMDVNLSKIQSVPRLNGEWEYMFYLDLELPSDPDIEAIMSTLAKYTSNLEVLGIYNKGEMLYES
jgi:prephenate dehydratase